MLMPRQTASYPVNNIKVFKAQMLSWVNRFGICCFMDNHDYEDKYHKYDCLAAAGSDNFFSPVENILPQLDKFYNENDDWIFGHLGYDLKNEIEGLHSNHTNKINFPDIFFFIPKVVLILKENFVSIESLSESPQKIFEELNSVEESNENFSTQKNIQLNKVLNKDEYVSIIKKIQQHILRGDCYEINYCQEFFAENIFVETKSTYKNLVEISPTPFSCFYKLNDKYLLCASPERFLSKIKSEIFSQPIKGTAPRINDAEADFLEKNNLRKNEKEITENVMIVDLVRNDLSKICKEGSVVTEELFGVYTFPQVHQMISTIKGVLTKNVLFSEIIRATFPMGSMTGAPKRRVMQLIEQYEKTKRGLFSGSVGYITPQKDFDFNVVIRSIFYNASIQYLNYLVGSAITFYADAEKEYEECKLKAKAMIAALK